MFPKVAKFVVRHYGTHASATSNRSGDRNKAPCRDRVANVPIAVCNLQPQTAVLKLQLVIFIEINITIPPAPQRE